MNCSTTPVLIFLPKKTWTSLNFLFLKKIKTIFFVRVSEYKAIRRKIKIYAEKYISLDEERRNVEWSTKPIFQIFMIFIIKVYSRRLQIYSLLSVMITTRCEKTCIFFVWKSEKCTETKKNIWEGEYFFFWSIRLKYTFFMETSSIDIFLKKKTLLAIVIFLCYW